MSKYIKFAALIGSMFNIAYLLWLIMNVTTVLGWLVVLAEFIFVTSFNLFLWNHWTQRTNNRSYRQPKGSLDVFLPVVNEPIDMFEKTLAAAANINYADKTVYVLDDGNRAAVKQLAKKYKAIYLARRSSRNYKAGNMNYGLKRSHGDFILVLDADQVVTKSIANHLLGHFQKDPMLSIVTTKQRYSVPRKDFNNDYLFYLHMQKGKNANNAAISTGTGVIYRRSALKVIGGFQTWNIVEDMYTSYILHRHGFTSLYVAKAYTTGTAPQDIPTIYKQRGTWATDTMRMFFQRNPLLVGGLTIRQRLHYFEMGFGYLMPAIAVPITVMVLPLSLVFHDSVIAQSNVYSLMSFPAFALIMATMYQLSNRTMGSIQYWMGLFPVYLKSTLLATQKTKMRYIVTSKTSNDSRAIRLVLPQCFVLMINIIALSVQLFDQVTWTDLTNLFWFAITAYCLLPVIESGLQLSTLRISKGDWRKLRVTNLRRQKFAFSR